jgi:hypothetical protein
VKLILILTTILIILLGISLVTYLRVIKMKKNELNIFSKSICYLFILIILINVIFIIMYIPIETKNNSTQIEGINSIFKDQHVIKNIKNYTNLLYKKNALWVYYRKNYIPKNAAKYIITPTPDKINQANHPDMVYFPNGFGGYKYWMACTPYPHSRQKYENPNVLVSNDGIHFIDPKNEKEPLTPAPVDVNKGGHLSDTDMFYYNNEFVLHIVYNKKGVLGPSRFYRITSSDGIHWNKLKLSFLCTQTKEGYSPAYIQDGSNIKMWYVGGEGNLDFTQSDDNEKTWSKVTRCKISMEPWKPWHVDVIKTNKGYEGLLCARNRLMNTRALFYIFSLDGVKWKCSKYPILFPSKNGWDKAEIYRSTLLKEKGLYRIWYSARGNWETWHIGYTEFKENEINNLKMN